MTRTTRREFLRVLGAGAAATFAGAPKTGIASGWNDFSNRDFIPDVEVGLEAIAAERPIFAGRPTRVWTYQGEVFSGDPDILRTFPGSYVGPVLRLRRGSTVRVRFANRLTEPSIVHWHGLLVPADMDGHPRDAIQPGQTFTYEFQVVNRAGTYWFHPHPDKLTGKQVYHGLAGVLTVSDPEEAALGLPSGEFDVPLVVQDRGFDSNNQFVYRPGAMMGRMTGVLGNRILVNGKPDFVLSVAPRAYRLRLLNGSNARMYKLAWSDGTPLTVIGTDGGFLRTPTRRTYLTAAPGERLDIWADFSAYPIGTEIKLNGLSFGGNSMTSGTLGNGPFSVLTVRVTDQIREPSALPSVLSTFIPHRIEDAVNRTSPRVFRFSMNGMRFTINGRTFEPNAAAADEIVPFDTLEAWEFVNDAGGMGMMSGVPHPVHVHGVQFQVVERSVAPRFAQAWESVKDGFVDEGWKDTVLVMPGERVKVLVKFDRYPGLFVYHCHNLEHEDAGMMRNLSIRPKS